jgi:hypothetical protein
MRSAFGETGSTGAKPPFPAAALEMMTRAPRRQQSETASDLGATAKAFYERAFARGYFEAGVA